MRAFKSLLFIPLLVGFSFALSACGDDDESNSNIAGTWLIDENASTTKYT